jgi:hypothetical protein
VKDGSAAEMGIIRKQLQQIVSNILAVAGVIVSVVTLIVMLMSEGFRNWVRHNPYWVFGGFVAAVVVILALLNFMQAKYAELRRLRSLDAVRRADQDKRAMAAFLARIPPAGVFIAWIKKGLNPSSVPLEKLAALDELRQYLASDPARFDDPQAAAGYIALTVAADAFSRKLLRWTSLEAGNVQRIIPVEWRQNAKYDRAFAEIKDAGDGLVVAYDAFLRTCHERGIEPG